MFHDLHSNKLRLKLMIQGIRTVHILHLHSNKLRLKPKKVGFNIDISSFTFQ